MTEVNPCPRGGERCTTELAQPYDIVQVEFMPPGPREREGIIGVDAVDAAPGGQSRFQKGAPVETSPHEIDQIHLDFWRECIDDTYGRHDAQPQVVMVPPVVAAAMAWADPAGSRVPFQRREIIYRPRASEA